MDATFNTAFSALYLFDRSGMKDSSKNLRVLWTRALLDKQGRLDDPVAYKLLPKGTRRIISRPFTKAWRLTSKYDWIVDRTNFIDSEIESFLDTHKEGERQIVLLGSGYDTRSMRYISEGLKFVEVDLPEVVETKMKLVNRYVGPRNGEISDVTYVPFDLNRAAGVSLVDTLTKEGGLKLDVPTLVVCEAVIFYLSPPAAKAAFADLFSQNFAKYVIVDNLAKLGVTPGGRPTPFVHEEKCKKWIEEKNGKKVMRHEEIWNGAIHFVSAESK